MILAVDHHHGVALEDDEDLLLVALGLVVLRDRVALFDLDDVQAERLDLEPPADELPAAVRLELPQPPDREAVGHARNDTTGTDPARGVCPDRRRYARPFAFKNALATEAGVFLSTATALFIAIIAVFVSFALTAFTASVNLAP